MASAFLSWAWRSATRGSLASPSAIHAENLCIKPKVSSLYPILYRLIDQGYISSYEEIIKNNRRRVYYHLEPKGFELLQQLIDDYQKYTASIQSILNYK